MAKQSEAQLSTGRTVKWIGLCIMALGCALYYMARVGTQHDYTAGKVVLIVGLTIVFSRFFFKE